MTDIILETRDLHRRFTQGGGLFAKTTTIHAVNGVSLQVRRGETFAIVGESGCGKSTLARLLLRLIDPSEGQVIYEGQDLTDLSGGQMRALRSDLQFIFQDPFSSLNPRMSVEAIIAEPLRVHTALSASERRAKVADLMKRVGLRPEMADRYPHEFSGGQRQRICIARALASGPKLLIGDEPVSALDVSVQAQIVNLLEDLKQEFGLTLLVIAHDLAVIRHMSDRIAVMYLGEVVAARWVVIFPRPPTRHRGANSTHAARMPPTCAAAPAPSCRARGTRSPAITTPACPARPCPSPVPVPAAHPPRRASRCIARPPRPEPPTRRPPHDD